MTFQIEYKTWSRLDGEIQFGYVPWDSEIFGVAIYQLNIPNFSNRLSESLQDLLLFLNKENKGKCLVFAKIPSAKTDLIRALTLAGFYPIETMVEVYRNLKSFNAKTRFKRLGLRPAIIEDKPHLLKIAYGAFSMDRYHLDPYLANDKASYRYKYWLDNGINAEDMVLVYEDSANGKTVGFCLLRELEQGTIDFSLGAIDADQQMTGLGAMMYSDCLLEYKSRGYEKLITRVSLNNVAVLNVFVSLGCLLREPMVTFHWHAD